MPALTRLRARDVVALARRRRTQIGLAVAALMFLGHFGAYTFISPYLEEQGGFSPSAVTALLLAYGVAGFVGNFTAAAVLPRNLPTTLSMATTILAASGITLAIWQSPPVVVIAVILWGTAFGAVPITLQTYMMGGRAVDAALALFVTVSQLFLATGAFTGGLVVDRLGLPTDYLLFAIPVLVAVALTLTLLTRLQHSDPGPAEPNRRAPRDTPQPLTPAPQPVRP
jgi:predicted MFS family arabinose efflux permease